MEQWRGGKARERSGNNNLASPSAETLTHVTGPKCPASVWISSPVCRSQTIKLQSFEPDITWLLLVTETATVRTASECPTSTCKRIIYESTLGKNLFLKLTCASLPPVACHTFSDISRDPVITWSESAVITKQVISSVWLTWYFSSSRVSDHILKLLSPFVLI